MPRRHYGIPMRTATPHLRWPSLRAGAWSGSAMIGAIVIVLIVLAVVLYGVSKIVADADNHTTSAPKTTGAGSPPSMGPSRDSGR